MQITTIKTNIFKKKQNLPLFIKKHISILKEGDILVVSSKVSALWEGATAPLKDKTKMIKKESSYFKKTKLCYFCVRQNLICANAGIDESNAFGKIILLPKNPYQTARKLRSSLCKTYKIKKVGVILSDSFILPLRAGVINVAVAHAGFEGTQNNCGQKDICGRKLKMTIVNIADSLASAAGLCMGEGGQKCPLAIIRGAPVKFSVRAQDKAMLYPTTSDFYYPFFKGEIYK